MTSSGTVCRIKCAMNGEHLYHTTMHNPSCPQPQLRTLRITISALALALTACSKSQPEPNVDPIAFGTHLRLQQPARDVRFEIVTLPETKKGDDGIGPTDYVSLIGLATLSNPDVKRISAESSYRGNATIPKAFIRPWLGKDATVALEEALRGARRMYDARAMVSRPSRRAFGVPVDGSRWLFYVEYVSPG